MFLDIGGPTLQMNVSNKPYYFEMHRYCGPMFTDRHGNSVDWQPDENHLFWTHFDAWMRQGQKVEFGIGKSGKIGLCVYSTDLMERRRKDK